ncbi:MAG TPA: mycofactocin-coupled SDR family oxidoreductase [Acidimicrobiales bacterium]|nr:mycofactocin-coupled SDR family oxidoreductase [Acidimicrobiales bacterium]
MTDGPVAVVTGAARGIGEAVARSLADAGWRLVLVDVCDDDPALAYPLATRKQLDQVAAATGGLAVVGDVRSQSDLDASVRQATERFGRLDAAVAAAGVMAGGRTAWETPEEAWRAVMAVNVEGVWRLARAAVPALLARPRPRSGRFVAISSVAGMSGMPLLAAYSAAKHAVVGLVRSLAAELGPEGITANVVSPGSTTTAMLEASALVYDLADTTSFVQHHLIPRLIEPAEVAAMVAWLVGPASSAVTGAVLPVDAGMSAST